MSTEEKVELVASVQGEYELTTALSAVELPKSTWYYHRSHKVSYEEKYAHLRPLLEEIAHQHPAYGIPRITKELHDNHDQNVNHKVIQRLLRLWDLSLLRSVQRPQPSTTQKAIKMAGKRANLVAQIDQIGLFEVVYTDFTELRYADGAHKAHLMPIIGHVSKMSFGWAVGQSADTTLALKAWKKAKETFQRLSIPFEGIIMHHDRDSVYTGYRWTDQVLVKDKVRLSYALNGAKDNPEMESFNGRFKTENRSLFLDAQNLDELCKTVAERMRYYNFERRHSSLDYVAPLAYLQSRKEGDL